MLKYTIEKLKEPLPDLTGVVFDPDDEPFCELPYAAIDSYVWDTNGYMPEARAYVAWSEDGLHVLLCAKEEKINVEATEFNGAVYRDSCLEFFLMPFPDDGRYFNFETNAGGYALIGFGKDRHDRIRLSAMPDGMNLTASRHRGGWWAVSYTIPRALFMNTFGRVPALGSKMKGNFYCVDETIHPHFGTWSPIIHFQPDFHRPEWFAEIIMEDK